MGKLLIMLAYMCMDRKEEDDHRKKREVLCSAIYLLYVAASV
jgi:hypothetical protein